MNTRAANPSTRRHRELPAEIVERFCPRFLPGGFVLYTRFAIPNQGHRRIDALASINFKVREHDRMPDVVLFDPKRKWLLLADIGTSGRIIDAFRRQELCSLFESSHCSLIYLTAFSDRDSFGASADAIAWETVVWIADEPNHLIEFDGGALRGPESKGGAAF